MWLMLSICASNESCPTADSEVAPAQAGGVRSNILAGVKAAHAPSSSPIILSQGMHLAEPCQCMSGSRAGHIVLRIFNALFENCSMMHCKLKACSGERPALGMLHAQYSTDVCMYIIDSMAFTPVTRPNARAQRPVVRNGNKFAKLAEAA